jgi:hypothetical protein
MATNSPQDDWHKTGLRLPRHLHESLHEAAALSGRSYNGEIVHRLERSLVDQAETDSDTVAKELAAIKSELALIKRQMAKR